MEVRCRSILDLMMNELGSALQYLHHKRHLGEDKLRTIRRVIFKEARGSSESLQVEIWLAIVTILRIQRDFYWKLYERLQVRLCQAGGKGRKRDIEAFETDMSGTDLHMAFLS